MAIPAAIATAGANLAGPIGDMAGAFLGDHFNRASAKRQMAFQEHMSSTAYQRAAKDLEAAGLNRILALGNPASSPAGASLPVNVPPLGGSLTNARVASANIDNVKAQTELTRVNTAKAASETALVNQQVQQSVAETALKNFMVAAGQGKLPHEIEELISRSLQQRGSAKYSGQLFKSEEEITRLRGYEADQQQVMKLFYQLAQPLLEPLLKSAQGKIGDFTNSARDGNMLNFLFDTVLEELGVSRSGVGSFFKGQTQPKPGTRARPGGR